MKKDMRVTFLASADDVAEIEALKADLTSGRVRIAEVVYRSGEPTMGSVMRAVLSAGVISLRGVSRRESR